MFFYAHDVSCHSRPAAASDNLNNLHGMLTYFQWITINDSSHLVPKKKSINLSPGCINNCYSTLAKILLQQTLFSKRLSSIVGNVKSNILK